MLEDIEDAIKNWQSRDKGSIRHTSHRIKVSKNKHTAKNKKKEKRWATRTTPKTVLMNTLSILSYHIIIPCCDVRYDNHINTMFDLSLPPAVWRSDVVLFVMWPPCKIILKNLDLRIPQSMEMNIEWFKVVKCKITRRPLTYPIRIQITLVICKI
jgi:hypothetical protein